MTDDFKCPHCQAINDTTDWLENWNWDGEVFEICCCECEQPSSIKVTVSVDYEHVESGTPGTVIHTANMGFLSFSEFDNKENQSWIH